MIRLDEKTKAWLAIRKEAARSINPATAEIFWTYGQVMDPYRIKQLSAEYDCVGRNYFARAPGSDVWVAFDDLPKSVVDEFWERMDRNEVKFVRPPSDPD